MTKVQADSVKYPSRLQHRPRFKVLKKRNKKKTVQIFHTAIVMEIIDGVSHFKAYQRSQLIKDINKKYVQDKITSISEKTQESFKLNKENHCQRQKQHRLKEERDKKVKTEQKNEEMPDNYNNFPSITHESYNPSVYPGCPIYFTGVPQIYLPYIKQTPYWC